MGGDKKVPCPPLHLLLWSLDAETLPQQVAHKYCPFVIQEWKKKTENGDVNVQGERWEHESFPLPVQQMRHMWRGEMTVTFTMYCTSNTAPFTISCFKRLCSKVRKKRKLSQTITFYWRTYLFLGLTCYLATLNDGKIYIESWLWIAFLQLGASLVIKVTH